MKIEVDYKAADTFLFAYITDISSMGIFVATDQPAAIGSTLALRFTPPSIEIEGEDAPPAPKPIPIEALGEVVWTTEGGSRGHAGMGIQFKDLEAASRSQILELVRAVAYLDGGG